MSGDGISLQTTLSQLGNVAKAQLKGQQQNQPTQPLSEQIDKSKDLKVNRVKQAEKADKGRIEAEEERRKRHPGQEQHDADGGEKTMLTRPNDEPGEEEEDSPADIGRLIDTRV